MVDPTRGNVPHLPSPSSGGTQDALVPHEEDVEPDDLDASLDSSLDELEDAEWFDDMLAATDDPDLPEPPIWRVGTLPGVLLVITPVVLLLGFGFGAVTRWSADAVLLDTPAAPAAAAPIRPARVEPPAHQPSELDVVPEVTPEVDGVAPPPPVVEVDAGEAAEVAAEPEVDLAPPVDDEASEAASVWSTLPDGDAPPATDDLERAEPAPVVAAEPAVAAPVQDAEAGAEVPAVDAQDEAPRRGLLNRLKNK